MTKNWHKMKKILVQKLTNYESSVNSILMDLVLSQVNSPQTPFLLVHILPWQNAIRNSVYILTRRKKTITTRVFVYSFSLVFYEYNVCLAICLQNESPLKILTIAYTKQSIHIRAGFGSYLTNRILVFRFQGV